MAKVTDEPKLRFHEKHIPDTGSSSVPKGIDDPHASSPHIIDCDALTNTWLMSGSVTVTYSLVWQSFHESRHHRSCH